MKVEHVIWSDTRHCWDLQEIYNICGFSDNIFCFEKQGHSSLDPFKYKIMGRLSLTEKDKNRFTICVVMPNAAVEFLSLDDYFSEQNPTGCRIVCWGIIR